MSFIRAIILLLFAFSRCRRD